MKRAMKAVAFAHKEYYFGEFHTVGNLNKARHPNTQIAAKLI